jgi:3-dehydroquinate synthase
MQYPTHIEWPPVHFASAGWRALNSLLENSGYDNICWLTDVNTQQHCLPIVREKLTLRDTPATITIHPGETNKYLSTVRSIWNQLFEEGLTRHSLLINVGGGSITDIGGFVASTFKRGIDFIHIPTTVLAQTDAAIGGKTGINYKSHKNQIGSFALPEAICCDPLFFDTLSARQLRSGLAEIIKHALIGDAKLWKQLTTDVPKNSDLQQVEWKSILEKSVAVKQQIIQEDPLEQGRRQLLNFGHTFGHAFETLTLGTSHELMHGEAVAVGMLLESYLSCQKEGLSESSWKLIKDYLTGLYEVPRFTLKEEQLASALRFDKKRQGDQLYCTLLQQIGQANVQQPLPKKDIRAVLKYYTQQL